jgi:hypothetical protein
MMHETGKPAVKSDAAPNWRSSDFSRTLGFRMRARKTWQEKLADDKGLPKVVRITPRMRARWGRGTVVIPAPREVDAIMRRVPKGRLLTIEHIRALLAKQHGATIGCPFTTGIFAWIAAHAAQEAVAAGKRRGTPWWRTLKTGGQLNEKYPGGTAASKRLLRAEGHRFVCRGHRWFVKDFEGALAPFAGAPGEM